MPCIWGFNFEKISPLEQLLRMMFLKRLNNLHFKSTFCVCVRRIMWGSNLSQGCGRKNKNEVQTAVGKDGIFIPKSKFAFRGS